MRWRRYRNEMTKYRSVVKIQNSWKMRRARREYMKRRLSIVRIQAMTRKFICRKQHVVQMNTRGRQQEIGRSTLERQDAKDEQSSKCSAPRRRRLLRRRRADAKKERVSLILKRLDRQIRDVRGYGIDKKSCFLEYWKSLLVSFIEGIESSRLSIDHVRKVAATVRLKIPNATEEQMLCALAYAAKGKVFVKGVADLVLDDTFRGEVKCVGSMFDLRALWNEIVILLESPSGSCERSSTARVHARENNISYFDIRTRSQNGNVRDASHLNSFPYGSRRRITTRSRRHNDDDGDGDNLFSTVAQRDILRNRKVELSSMLGRRGRRPRRRARPETRLQHPYEMERWQWDHLQHP